MDIEYDFDRFVTAQDAIYETALAELKAGRKESHWMWYIFPQIEGLGVSQTSAFYAVSGKEEALNAFFGGVACQETLKNLRIAFYESLNE